MSIAFDQPDIETLKAQIQKELKDIPYESMKIRPVEGIELDPIYTQSNYRTQIPMSTNTRIIFSLYSIEDIQSANKEILQTLEQGINGIILDLKQKDFNTNEIEGLFKNIRLDYIYTEFLNLSQTTEATILSFLQDYPHPLSALQTALNNDVYCIANDLFLDESSKLLLSGISSGYIHIELSGDYFWDIAKIRAIKILLTNRCLLDGETPHFIFIGEPTVKNKSTEQIENNLLKQTTEAMSGIIGGCEGIWIRSFDGRADNPFSQRISKNIAHLMQEEAYLHLVEDASEGSYFVENYTEQIAKAIYNKL